MKVEKLLKIERKFFDEHEQHYVDITEIENIDNNILEIANNKLGISNSRPFTHYNTWDDKYFFNRKSLNGGIETWDGEIVYALKIENKLFELQEIKI